LGKFSFTSITSLHFNLLIFHLKLNFPDFLIVEIS
jgi:hypothetical protein